MVVDSSSCSRAECCGGGGIESWGGSEADVQREGLDQHRDNRRRTVMIPDLFVLYCRKEFGGSDNVEDELATIENNCTRRILWVRCRSR